MMDNDKLCLIWFDISIKSVFEMENDVYNLIHHIYTLKEKERKCIIIDVIKK